MSGSDAKKYGAWAGLVFIVSAMPGIPALTGALTVPPGQGALYGSVQWFVLAWVVILTLLLSEQIRAWSPAKAAVFTVAAVCIFIISTLAYLVALNCCVIPNLDPKSSVKAVYLPLPPLRSIALQSRIAESDPARGNGDGRADVMAVTNNAHYIQENAITYSTPVQLALTDVALLSSYCAVFAGPAFVMMLAVIRRLKLT